MWFGNSFSNYIMLLIHECIYPSIDFYVLFLLEKQNKTKHIKIQAPLLQSFCE